MLKHMEKEQSQSTIYLENLAQPMRDKGLEVESVVLQGTAGDIIVNYANENEIELIAIATHGRGGVRRAMFGSIADHVLRHTSLPMLVIKPMA